RSYAPNTLIDIQAKLRKGKGEGYRQLATIFNVKAMTATLIWLRNNNIDSYDDLKRRAAVGSEFSERIKAIRAAEEKLKSIAKLEKEIGAYGSARSVWEAYKKSDWDTVFFETNRAYLTLR
ncbi:MAG: relaxase, partial [Syntrophomonadaceae bacterium]|nr:relaxase [Syntrophomonadaceae bacterium]